MMPEVHAVTITHVDGREEHVTADLVALMADKAQLGLAALLTERMFSTVLGSGNVAPEPWLARLI
ncbi:MAG: hypothetical protein FD189_1096 [Elusimicrobia bacterium]|nr:MAG: hypothetical protein FD189_1096 [Elusimicrobiota bacterium]